MSGVTAGRRSCLCSGKAATIPSKVMNSVYVALALLLAGMNCFGQGQVLFANRVLAGQILDAPVTIAGTQEGPGPDYRVQLLLVGAGNSLTPLLPVSQFYPKGAGGQPISSRYWLAKDVIVPGFYAGEEATFIVRAWATAFGSYEAAFSSGTAASYGTSEPFVARVAGRVFNDNAPPIPPTAMVMLKSFVIVPESSPISLGLLGGAALMLFRSALTKSTRLRDEDSSGL